MNRSKTRSDCRLLLALPEASAADRAALRSGREPKRLPPPLLSSFLKQTGKAEIDELAVRPLLRGEPFRL